MMAYEFLFKSDIVGFEEKSTIVLAKSVSMAIETVSKSLPNYPTRMILLTHDLIDGKISPHDYATIVLIICYRDGLIRSNGISYPGEVVPYETRFMAANMVDKTKR